MLRRDDITSSPGASGAVYGKILFETTYITPSNKIFQNNNLPWYQLPPVFPKKLTFGHKVEKWYISILEESPHWSSIGKYIRHHF